MKRLFAVIFAFVITLTCALVKAPAEELLPAFDPSGYDPYTAVVCEWLLENEAGSYLQGDVAIPSPVIIETDESDPEDILVWGIFNIHWYELRNTTLFCVSGGSRAGLMHIRETDGEYTVVEFEGVGDGSDFGVDSERIFGMREGLYDKYRQSAMTGDAAELQFVSDYVNMNCLDVTQLQHFGWDPVPLINAPETAEEDQMVLHESALGYSIEYDLRRFCFMGFDEYTDCICGVGELEGISVDVSRCFVTAEEAVASLSEDMEMPVKENATLGAEDIEAILLYDDALPEGVSRMNYILPMPYGCILVKTSNTYYAATEMEVVPGAEEAIGCVLATFRLTEVNE